MGRYDRAYSFSGFQNSSPATPLPAGALDNELINIEAAINDHEGRLAEVERLSSEYVDLDAAIAAAEGYRDAAATSAGTATTQAGIATTAASNAVAAANTNAPYFADTAAAIASTDLDTIAVVYVDGMRFEYSASSVSVGGFQNTDSARWYKLADPIIDTSNALFVTPTLAAQFAYDNNIPLRHGTGEVPVSVAFDSDGEANYVKVYDWVRWRSSCDVGGFGNIKLVPAAAGLYPLDIHDVPDNGLPIRVALDWFAGNGPLLFSDISSGTLIDITSVTIGTRGSHNHPVYRRANQYPATYGLASALPSRVEVGFSVWAQHINGDNDAAVASGPLIVEWIAGDRLSFRATIESARVIDLVSPTTINNGGIYRSMLESKLRVPQTCFVWQSRYTEVATVAVSAITNANPCSVTASLHGQTAGNDLLCKFTGAAPAELLDRMFVVGTTPDVNTLTLKDANNVAINSTSYVSYGGSGASITFYTQDITGSAQEAFLNPHSGASIWIDHIGWSWGGWLQGLSGILMDLDFCTAKYGGKFQGRDGAVFAGAGDKVFRFSDTSNLFLNRCAAGGGGCQSWIYTEGCNAVRADRCGFGHSASQGSAALMLDSHVYNGCWFSGSTSELVNAEGGSVVRLNPDVLVGGSRGAYAAGGRIITAATTEIGANQTGLDGTLDGIVEGTPTYGGSRGVNVINTALQADGWGSAASNKGNARHIAVAGNAQKPPTIFTELLFGAGASLNLDSGSATDAGSGVTINKMACLVTSQSLTTAAGAKTSITLTNSVIVSTSQIDCTVQGGSFTTGIPYVTVRDIAAGSCILDIHNVHPSVALNGTVIVRVGVATS